MKIKMTLPWTCWSIFILVCFILILPVDILSAPVTCTSPAHDNEVQVPDTSPVGDGFCSDKEEGGFNHFDGQTSSPRNMDSSKIDLFYIHNIVDTAHTQAPVSSSDLLAFVSSPYQADDIGGLGLIVHEIQFSHVDSIETSSTYRQVMEGTASNQKTMILKENTSEEYPETQVFGTTSIGTPQSVNSGMIYTNVIRGVIDEECGTGFADGPGDSTVCIYVDENDQTYTGRELFKKFAQHVFAHEAGHMLGSLTVAPDVIDGNHTRKNDNVMGAEITYKAKQGRTTFFIRNNFRDEDHAAAKVR